jgi:AsmA protein
MNGIAAQLERRAASLLFAGRTSRPWFQTGSRGFRMKPRRIAALGFAALLAAVVLAAVFGVPAGFLAKYAQDQAIRAGYRLHIDGHTTLALRPAPIFTLGEFSVSDAIRPTTGLAVAANGARVSLSLMSLLSGRPAITELTVTRPVIRVALARESSSRPSAAPARQNEGSGTAAAPAVTVDRLIVEDGTVIMSNARDRFEMRIDRIAATGSLDSAAARLDVRAVAGDQPVHLVASAKTPFAGLDGANVPVEISFEAPGFLDDKVTGTADVRAGGSVFRINGLAGKIGKSPLNGWASVDFTGKPLVKADFDVERLALAASPPPSGIGPPQRLRAKSSSASATWSGQEIRLIGLNYVDADVSLSATELNVGAVRAAPVAVHATLNNGVLDVALAPSRLYGGDVQATVSVNASDEPPVHALHIDLTGARALPLLTDLADFGSLDGRLQSKVDVRASGNSANAIVSSLGGTADVRIQDGQILGINVAKMIRTLTARTLLGWEDNHTESTDLTELSARFRLQDGRAQTNDLRLFGQLVRVTGSGTIDLNTKTLQFKLDPKLVASLEGQGGRADPLGFGVPVNIEGSWSDPHIYPDVAGILSDPDGAYAKLHALGQGLFGKGDAQSGSGNSNGNGNPVDTLIQGLGNMLSPKNESPKSESRSDSRSDSRTDRRDNRDTPPARPQNRPSLPGAAGDLLREFLGR